MACNPRGNSLSIMAIQDLVSDYPRSRIIKSTTLSSLLIVVETIGYIMRVYGHSHLNVYNPYVTMQALVVCFGCEGRLI